MEKTLLLALSAVCSVANATEWSEHRFVDRMTEKPSHVASLRATNEVRLRAPFGETGARMFFSSTDGLLLGAFSVSAGILECSPPTGCRIEVKADDQVAVSFKAETTRSGYTNAFFTEPNKVADYIAGAKTILVRAPMFREGRVIFEFSQSGPMPVLQKATP